MKFCKKCQAETERNASGQCKLCTKARGAAWIAANKDRKKANDAAWAAANKNKIKEKKSAYRLANTENIKAARASYYAANRERNRADQAARRAANPEKNRARVAAWAAANPERAKASQSAFRKANPEAMRVHGQNRRARKRENGGVLSKGLSAKLFKLQCGKCACCGLPLGANYHLDHIMPIALEGPNIDSNMQLLRQRCNHQKRAKHPIDFMQSRGFLL